MEVRSVCFTYQKKQKRRRRNFINEKENREERERKREIQFANFIMGCSLGKQIMWLLGEQPCHLYKLEVFGNI